MRGARKADCGSESSDIAVAYGGIPPHTDLFADTPASEYDASGSGRNDIPGGSGVPAESAARLGTAGVRLFFFMNCGKRRRQESVRNLGSLCLQQRAGRTTTTRVHGQARKARQEQLTWRTISRDV